MSGVGGGICWLVHSKWYQWLSSPIHTIWIPNVYLSNFEWKKLSSIMSNVMHWFETNWRTSNRIVSKTCAAANKWRLLVWNPMNYELLWLLLFANVRLKRVQSFVWLQTIWLSFFFISFVGFFLLRVSKNTSISFVLCICRFLQSCWFIYYLLSMSTCFQFEHTVRWIIVDWKLRSQKIDSPYLFRVKK